MAAKIKVGDRVRHRIYGLGFVKFDDLSPRFQFAVEFDVNHESLHDCRGVIQSGKGRWCDIKDLAISSKRPLNPDYFDTDILDVPVRVHYTFEKGYEGKSDSIDITTVTHLGVDVTAFALALHQDQFESEISKYENADYCPEHDD